MSIKNFNKINSGLFLGKVFYGLLFFHTFTTVYN